MGGEIPSQTIGLCFPNRPLFPKSFYWNPWDHMDPWWNDLGLPKAKPLSQDDYDKSAKVIKDAMQAMQDQAKIKQDPEVKKLEAQLASLQTIIKQKKAAKAAEHERQALIESLREKIMQANKELEQL